MRRIEVLEHRGQLATEVSNASASWRERRGVLLRLWDEDGRAGQGEASPLPGYSRDALPLCVAELRGLAPEALDAELGPDGVSLRRPGTGLTCAAARHAVETALLDLLGQRRGVSVSALLGAPRAEVPLSVLLEDGAGPEARGDDLARALCAAGRHAVAAGAQAVKWKLGRRPFADELLALAALRAEIGAGVALTLDANRKWGADEAEVLRRLERLSAIGPAYVEEPFSVGVRWPAGAAVPLALDESLQGDERRSAARLEDLLRRGAVSVVVLKPMALGGVLRCLELARRAAAAGVGSAVTHLFDGPVALAVAAELALSLPVVDAALPCGLWPHPGLSVWPAWRAPQVQGGVLRGGGWAGLGLGVETREEGP